MPVFGGVLECNGKIGIEIILFLLGLANVVGKNKRGEAIPEVIRKVFDILNFFGFLKQILKSYSKCSEVEEIEHFWVFKPLLFCDNFPKLKFYL